MCRDHPIAAPVWGMPGTILLRKGDTARIMLPKVDLAVSSQVTGFREVMIGRCVECGDLFDGRSDKKYCDNKACKQAFNRRVQ